MAVAHVAQRINFGSAVRNTSHTVPITNPTAITVGNHLVMSLGLPDSTALSSITDPRGNTWTVDQGSSTAFGRGALVSCKVSTGYQAGDSLTIALAASKTLVCIANEFSGLDPTTWHAGGNSTAAASSSFASGVTSVAAGAGDLVFGAIGGSSSFQNPVPTAEGSTPTAWSNITHAIQAGDTAAWAEAHYRIVDGAESPNYDGTMALSRSHGASIGVYRIAGGGGGPVLVRSYGSGVIG